MKRKVIQVSSKYTAKDGSERWRNCTVGSAFLYDDGNIALALDPGVSIASVDGVKITIREPFDKDAPQQQRGGSAQRDNSHPAHGSDDDIPF